MRIPASAFWLATTALIAASAHIAARSGGLSPGGESISVGPQYDFEDFALGTLLTGPDQPLFPNQIDVRNSLNEPSIAAGQINNVYNKLGSRSLEAQRDGSPSFFFQGESLVVSTGDASTNAFSVYININPSSQSQLFLDYVDPLGTETQTFLGGAGTYDTSSFYVLGVIADRGNTAFRFGALKRARR